MTPSLRLVSGFLLAPAAAGLLGSVLCSRSILNDKRPPWSVAYLSILFGLLCALWVIFGGDLIRPAHWRDSIPDVWTAFVMALGPVIGFTTFGMLVVVSLFRERFKKHVSWRQRCSLHHQTRHRRWQRVRWFHLFASSTLVVALTGLLMWFHSVVVPAWDAAAVSASYKDSSSAAAMLPTRDLQRAATPRRPAFDLAVEGTPGSVCLLGLVASGGWLAYTLTYWRGYLRVMPRHRRELLVRHHAPAQYGGRHHPSLKA
jgi:hypothetical protein